MIKHIVVSVDDAGFPIVRWIESRGHFAARGPGQQRVECRIMKDATTGELMFVARGAKRYGSFEHGKQWQVLQCISVHAAASLYRSSLQRIILDGIAQKGTVAKLTWTDAGQVFTADFRRDERVHINDADASKVELEQLHIALTNAFFGREQLVANLCQFHYRWPIDDVRVETYVPSRTGWPDEKRLPLLLDVLMWTIPIVGVCAFLVGFLWLAGLLKLAG